jgi:hypothetical protein
MYKRFKGIDIEVVDSNHQNRFASIIQLKEAPNDVGEMLSKQRRSRWGCWSSWSS